MKQYKNLFDPGLSSRLSGALLFLRFTFSKIFSRNQIIFPNLLQNRYLLNTRSSLDLISVKGNLRFVDQVYVEGEVVVLGQHESMDENAKSAKNNLKQAKNSQTAELVTVCTTD